MEMQVASALQCQHFKHLTNSQANLVVLNATNALAQTHIHTVAPLA